MEQAIIEIGPHVAKYRGVDGFWLGPMATSQIPRAVVTGLLGRVDQKNQGERERVVRFLMDAGWYPEARAELDKMIRDFPKTDLGERATGARTFIVQAEATQRRGEIDVRRKAQQFRQAEALLEDLHREGDRHGAGDRGPGADPAQRRAAGRRPGPGDRSPQARGQAARRLPGSLEEAGRRGHEGHRAGPGRRPRQVRGHGGRPGALQAPRRKASSRWRCRGSWPAATRPSPI